MLLTIAILVCLAVLLGCAGWFALKNMVKW
jgi:hypothetical protein